MDVLILEDPHAVAVAAADLVTALALEPEPRTLGLATGATPLPVYAELARRGADLSRLRGVSLDEYVGLPPSDRDSYRDYLERHVRKPLGIALDTLDGCADDLTAECLRYEQVLRSGVALQLLGIGRNGHLGFNEPGSSSSSRTRPTTLSESTRADNARHVTGPVPRRALTQGIGTIMGADHLVLLATGAAKAEVLRAALEGPVTELLPASVLQRHDRVTVLADRAAGRLLARTDERVRVPAGQGV